MAGAAVETLLAAGHETVATQATLLYRTAEGAIQVETTDLGSGQGVVDLVRTVDALGQTCTIIDASVTSATCQASAEHWVAWTHGGALPDPDRVGEVLTGAGALARWWLERSSLRVDRGRWAAAAALLDRFKVAGYSDEQVVPWEWVADNLLPILPVSIHAGADGIYPVPWRWDAGRRDVVEWLIAGAGVALVDGVEHPRGEEEIASEVRVSWALDAAEQAYRRTTTWQAERDEDDPESHSSYGAATSWQRYSAAERPEEPIARVEELSTDVVYDEATAHLVASQLLARVAFSPRVVTYDCPQEYGWLDLGDVVAVTDTGLYLDEAIAIVVGHSLSDLGRVVLDLQLVADPARDPRTTGPDPTDDDYDDDPDPDPPQ
jgi:hypothetical protein